MFCALAPFPTHIVDIHSVVKVKKACPFSALHLAHGILQCAVNT